LAVLQVKLRSASKLQISDSSEMGSFGQFLTVFGRNKMILLTYSPELNCCTFVGHTRWCLDADQKSKCKQELGRVRETGISAQFGYC
jgi:hypothetical protein